MVTGKERGRGVREAHSCIDLTHSSCSEEVDTCATDIAKSLNISYNSTTHN